jgi:DUF4097 and DUF4098 domain-containing protein YvlB
MSRLWIVLGSIPAVLALSFGTLQTVGVLAHEETTVTQTFDVAEVTSLQVGDENGPVEITGADVEQITVMADISRGLQATRHRAAVADGVLVVDAECPHLPMWCDVAYTITVPRDLPITVDLDNGRLTLRDLDGAITADGDNGRIELLRLGGELRITNDNGRIEGSGLRSPIVDTDTDNGRTSLIFAEAPDFVTATSNNGGIAIVVPDDGDPYRVDARTDNGSTDVGITTDPTSDRSITVHTDNGSATVRYPTG